MFWHVIQKKDNIYIFQIGKHLYKPIILYNNWVLFQNKIVHCSLAYLYLAIKKCTE